MSMAAGTPTHTPNRHYMRDHSSMERAFSFVQASGYSVVFMVVLVAPMAAYLPRPAGKVGVIVLCFAILFTGMVCGALALLLHHVLSATISQSQMRATGHASGLPPVERVGARVHNSAVGDCSICMRGRLAMTPRRTRSGSGLVRGES